MRVILVASLVALIYPAVAPAQTAPAPPGALVPPTATSTRGGDITKDQYVERAVERARRAAEKRFDKLDTNHDGVLTADERSAARAARAKRRAEPAQ